MIVHADERGEWPEFMPDTLRIAVIAKVSQDIRTARGIDSDGRLAPPLSRRYEGLKRWRGLPQRRDLRLTGDLMGSRQVVPVDGGHGVVVGPGRQAKAEELERQHSMLGLAPSDIAAMDAALQTEE